MGVFNPLFDKAPPRAVKVVKPFPTVAAAGIAPQSPISGQPMAAAIAADGTPVYVDLASRVVIPVAND